MDDDPGEGAVEDERALELSTIAAIYPEIEIGTWKGPFSASLDITVEPIVPFVIYSPAANGAQSGSLAPSDPPEAVPTTEDGTSQPVSQHDTHTLSYLPSLTVKIALTPGYPINRPAWIALEAQHSWLPKPTLNRLEHKAYILWEKLGRDQVIFAYIDYLQGEAEKGFDQAEGKGKILVVPTDLQVKLLDFDLKAKRAKFERETFDCGICLGRFSRNRGSEQY